MVMGWDVSGDQYMSYVELDAPSPPSAAHALLMCNSLYPKSYQLLVTMFMLLMTMIQAQSHTSKW